MVDDPDNPYRAPGPHAGGLAAGPRPPDGRGFRWQVIPATLCGFLGVLLALGYIGLVELVVEDLGSGGRRRLGPPTVWLPGLVLGAMSAASFLLASRSWYRRTTLAAALLTVAGIACYALSALFSP